jgi:hypothetical protein
MALGKKGSEHLKKRRESHRTQHMWRARSFLSPHQFSTALPQVAERVDVHFEYVRDDGLGVRRALLKECSACCFQEEHGDAIWPERGAEHHNAAD